MHFMIKFTGVIVLTLLMFSAMSQDSVRSTIEKAYKDTLREKNAAKADRLIHGKRIFDTTQVNKAAAEGISSRREPKQAKRRKKE